MRPETRTQGLLVQELGDEILIYDREDDRVHVLNKTTALIWRHCDGQTSITEMAALLARELHLPADEELVWLALEQLGKLHLLQDSVQVSTDRVDRRQVLMRLGLTGALAVLVPAVSSILAPREATAQYQVEKWPTTQEPT